MSDAARVTVIGDGALDITVAATVAVVPGADRPATIRMGAGGQGANVAVRLARRGIEVQLVTAIGPDLAGDWLRARLADEGVALAPAAAPAAATSMVVALLDATGERTMLSDRMPLAVDPAALAALMPASDWVHCSGYVLRDPSEAEPIIEVLAARGGGPRLSVGGGSADAGDVPGAMRAALEKARPDLLVVGRDEARWLAADPDADPPRAIAALTGTATVVVVTAGAAGADGAAGGGPVMHVPAAGVGPALDATGAGDAFAAVLLAGLLHEAWPPGPGALRAALAEAARAGGLAARAAGAQGPIAGERGPATVSGT